MEPFRGESVDQWGGNGFAHVKKWSRIKSSFTVAHILLTHVKKHILTKDLPLNFHYATS